MDRAPKKYFRYFFSPSPLRLLWGWYHELQSKYIGPGAFSHFRQGKTLKIQRFSFLEKSDHSFHVNFFLFAGFQWRERGRQFRVDFIPNCLLLFTWDALISKYHQIWSQPSLFSRLAVGITVAATVKTNLIIIRVMFFGISVHLPANFDGICRAHSLLAQHTFCISCQSAELGSVITPGVQLGTRLRELRVARYHPQSHHRVIQPFTRKSIWIMSYDSDDWIMQ